MRPPNGSVEIAGEASPAGTRTGEGAGTVGGDRPAGADLAARSDLLRPEMLIFVALALGFTLRVLQYGANRSLWLDEILMVPAIVRPSFLDLLDPGNWSHLPPGFLFLEKLVVSVAGASELALRLLPFLAGLAAMFLFVGLARRFVRPTAVPVAVGLFALSPFLIYYSSEVKPYSTDVLVSTVLLFLVSDLVDGGVTRRRAATLGLAGVVAAGFSLTSVFIVVGAVAALLVRAWRGGAGSEVRTLLTVLAGWAVVFGVPYVLFVHGSATNEYAREFWRSGFMPLPPRSAEELAWLPRTLFQVFRDPLGVFSDRQSTSGIFGATAGLVAFAVGCASMAKRSPARLWVLVAPITLTLLASAFMLYPFGGSRAAAGRVLLFLVPVFFLVMAEGVAWLWHRFTADARIVPLAMLAMLFVPTLMWGAVAVPIPRTEIKPLLEYLEEEAQPGDVVYVHYDIRHAFEHYAPDYDLPGVLYQPGVCARGEPARYLDSLARFRGAPRLWVLFGNGQGAGLFDEKAISLDYLEHTGTRLDDQVSHGASLYLYDLRAKDGSTPYRAELPVVPLSIADGCALWN